MSFTASIESVKVITKTSFDSSDGKVSWAAGDQILINGTKFSTNGTGSTVEFKNEGSLGKLNSPYEAYYPAANGASISAKYQYDDAASYLPLYAASNDYTLRFRNVCGVIGIFVTKTEMSVVQKIRISCTNKAMCGNYSINDANEAKLITDKVVNGNNSIVLDCAPGKTVDDAGTMFYIPVPPGYYENIKIELSSDGTSYDKVLCAKQDTVNIPVNTIWRFLPVGSYSLSQEPTVDKML